VALCQTLQDEDAARQAPAPFPTTSDPQLLDELAQGLEQTGEGAEARRTWLLALSGPVLRDTLTASRMLLRVARSFLAAEREDDALRCARTLTTVFPGTPAAGGATRLLAQQESKAGRPAEALALLETLRPAQSADLSLRTQWVKALARVGREEKSRTELQRLLKENNGRVNEDTVKAAVGLARGIGLLERKLPAEAEKAFGQVVGKQERTPQAAAAQLGVARALQAQGKLPACGKALLALEKRWPRAPEAAGAQTLKAELAEAAGDTTQALAALERAVDLSPAAQRPGALSAWIDAAARLQRPRVERTSLERYLSENPQAADAEARRLELALLLAEAGEGAAARAALRALQAEADETRSAEIQYRLGELAEREGDLPGAVLEYQKVPHVKDASRLDWDASAMFAAARCWEALGRRPEALETLRQIQTRQGENSGHGMRAKAELERLGALQP
jgi:tetratricopeptide (TPR) repeat protein